MVGLLAGCSALIDADAKKLGGRDIVPSNDAATSNGDGSLGGDAGPGGDGAGMGCPACDDGIECTADQCVGEACTHVPNDGICAPGERCSATKGCVPTLCRDASDCSDANACNGLEQCQPGAGDPVTGCIPGTPPDCDDGIECTADSCDPSGGCVHPPDVTRCDDGVGCTVDSCDPFAGCQHMPDDTGCDFCAPGAQCSPTAGCVGGFLPRSCNDDDPCTKDRCDPALEQCVHEGSCEDTPDTCASAESLELGFDGTARVEGTLGTLTSDFNTSCGQSGGRDAVYRLQIDEVADIVLDSTASDARTVLGVARTCSAQGFAFACAANVSNVEGGSRLVLHRYDPARFGSELFVLVDGLSSAEDGDYTLDVRVTPVADDTCEGDVLELDGCGTVVGFMDSREPSDQWGTLRGTCQSGSGEKAPESIIHIQGALDGNVSLSATSDDFSPAMYVRSECANQDGKNELACENAASGGNQASRADFTVQLPLNQDAFVIIDGAQHDGDRYVFRCIP